MEDVANFADRLAEAVTRKQSQLVVGLDPRLDLLPMELRGEAVLGRAAAASSVARFCKGIVDAVGPYVVAVKPQTAFFEALGADGFRALEEVSDYARGAGLLVLMDAKRGDIGSTSRAYAEAYLEPRDVGSPLADAMTASPYLGLDSVEPFLAACRRHGAGVFFLVRTSNAGAADVQDLAMSDGNPLWHHVAHLVHEWGEPLVGDVRDVEHRRRRRGDAPAGGLRGASPAPALAHAAPRCRCTGCDPGRRRAGFHRRACERLGDGLPLGDLRLSRQRRGLALGCRRRGPAARRPGLGCGRLVAVLQYIVAR